MRHKDKITMETLCREYAIIYVGVFEGKNKETELVCSTENYERTLWVRKRFLCFEAIASKKTFIIGFLAMLKNL